MGNTIRKTIVALVLCAVCSACNKQYEEPEYYNLEKKTTRLVMSCAKEGFDNKHTRIVSNVDTTIWQIGDKVYLAFDTEQGLLNGEATYLGGEEWELQYEGTLLECEVGSCSVRHFANTKMETPYLISFNSDTQVYEDAAAQYSHTENTVYINASLSPKTARVRFQGNVGDTVCIYGLSQYTSYSPTTDKFFDNKPIAKLCIKEDGYTPYIYGFFATDSRNICTICNEEAFTRTMTDKEMQPGQSGYLKVPTLAQHNKWRTGMCVMVGGVEFKMVPVAGHSSGFYLMGETEVTEAMYAAMIGSSSNSQYPRSSRSYYYITSSIDQLKAKTLLNFCLPSKEQWEYAASGGNQSQGYIYAGSDYADDVAWYSGNSSSIHVVKQKLPNELGLYDMSGNVQELIDVDSASTNKLVVGGSYSDSQEDCTPQSYKWITSVTYDNVGFRLCLTID